MRNDYLKKVFVVGAILLLAGTNFVSALNRNFSTDSMSLKRGNIFYVGGSGSGNYTRIQDAINNASDGDTVFVFDDSSPYYENIIINKSINFLGENKNTTVIDGMASDRICVAILADNVNLSNFTIQNAPYTNNVAIWIRSGSNDVILENNIFNCYYGIYIDGNTGDDASYNIIRDNYFYNCTEGIYAFLSFGNVIFNNKIYKSFNKNIGGGVGIDQSNCVNTVIENNDIRESGGNGISIYHSKNLTIQSNNIIENWRGISICYSSNATIIKNNIYSNKRRNVDSINYVFPRIVFDGNYWGKARTKPKVIFGIQELYLFTIDREVVSHGVEHIPIYLPLPTVALDRNPAQEPFDIE
jgi:parallel beta-helix repeat protein